MNRRTFLAGAIGTLFFPLVSGKDITYTIPSGFGVCVPGQDEYLHDKLHLIGNPIWHDWGDIKTVFNNQRWPSLWNLHSMDNNYWKLCREWTSAGKIPMAYSEPDGWDILPEIAASAMYKWNAPFIGYGTIVNDAGFKWLDKALEIGPRPSALHFHLYPFQEYAPNYDNITDRWKYLFDTILDWNQGKYKLVLSETNATTSGIEDQKSVMKACRDRLNEKTVEAIFWYSCRGLNWDEYDVFWLIDSNDKPTELGLEFIKILQGY